MSKSNIILVAGFFIFCGCSKPSDSSVPIPTMDESKTCIPEANLMAANIVGGTRVAEGDSDSKKVMMLYSEGELCTASAIAPRVLLTAAHCVQGAVTKSFAAFHISLSCESGFDARANSIEVEEFVVHSGYDKMKEASPNDIALVFLKDNIPAGYPIYKIADSNLVSSKNDLYFWGYGNINYKKGGAGILRKTQISGTDYKVDSLNKVVQVTQSNGHGVCNGDSGGPGLVNQDGELQILGVNSYVKGRADSLCNGEAFLTLADSFKSWISAVLKTKNEKLRN
ncbi:MAG: S1 family peptidase [Pseudobdellovibrio sp.]